MYSRIILMQFTADLHHFKAQNYHFSSHFLS